MLTKKFGVLPADYREKIDQLDVFTLHGIVPTEMQDAFEKYEYETGVKDALAIDGNCGALL